MLIANWVNPMSTKNINKKYILIGGIAGFLLGVCGNLVAAWIQQDIINNSFTPQRIGLLFFSTLIGIVVMVILESKMKGIDFEEKLSDKNYNSYSKIRLAWSRLRTRGRNIKIDDVSAVGSDIDIETK
jgi:hypothetical protein